MRTQAEKILQEAKSVMPLLANYMNRFHVQGCIRYCQGVSKGWRSGVGVYAVSCSRLSFQEGQNFSAGAGAVRPGVG